MSARPKSTSVVPELAAVPVLRTVTVQVPLGVDVGLASFCATNGAPPSPIDMTRSTAEEAADAGAGARPMASNETHVVAMASACTLARMRAGSTGLGTATP